MTSTVKVLIRIKNTWKEAERMPTFDEFMSLRGVGGRTDNASRPLRFEIVNSEGEIYTVDMSDRNCPFQGEVWRRILSAASDRSDLIPVAVEHRNRSQEGAFSGYEVSFGYEIKGFLPRSRSGYYYGENRDASGKRLAVRILEFYPTGSRQGDVLVEAAQLHGKNGVWQKIHSGDEVWGLAVDVMPSGMILLELPGGRFGLANVDAALRLTGCRYEQALTGRFYRVRVGKPYSSGENAGWDVWSVSLLAVQPDQF